VAGDQKNLRARTALDGDLKHTPHRAVAPRQRRPVECVKPRIRAQTRLEQDLMREVRERMDKSFRSDRTNLSEV
jgi:hypothetical protein